MAGKDFLSGLMGSGIGGNFGVPSSFADFTGVQLGPDPAVDALKQLLSGMGNGDAKSTDRRQSDHNRGGDQSTGGKLVIKPRPTPPGYKPPLDRWHGIQMQPAAINSLQAAGRIGRLIAGHATSSYRTYQQQVPLWRRYQAGGYIAARPGSSYHQQGLAIDDPWIRTNHKAMHYLLSHGWENGANFGDPNHWTYRVDG